MHGALRGQGLPVLLVILFPVTRTELAPCKVLSHITWMNAWSEVTVIQRSMLVFVVKMQIYSRHPSWTWPSEWQSRSTRHISKRPGKIPRSNQGATLSPAMLLLLRHQNYLHPLVASIFQRTTKAVEACLNFLKPWSGGWPSVYGKNRLSFCFQAPATL